LIWCYIGGICQHTGDSASDQTEKNTAGLWKLEKCVYLAVRKEKVELKKLICLSTKYLLKPIRGVRYESEEIK
jgi:hypothetical protein